MHFWAWLRPWKSKYQSKDSYSFPKTSWFAFYLEHPSLFHPPHKVVYSS